MPTPLPTEFVAALRQQRGVFTRAQALACGVGDEVVLANVHAERWRRVGRGLYTAFTGPLHDRHLMWIAVLAGGPEACLSHETAAHLHGLLATRPPLVHVLVPYGRSPDHRPSIRVHRTRSPRRISGSPPITSVADTLCDLAASGWPVRRLSGLVATAVQRGLTDETLLLAAIDGRGPFPGVGALRELARDTGAGAESVLELRYLRDVERAHGLPTGTRQARVRRHDGSVAVRDVYYAPFAMAVELDGAQFHAPMGARLRDARRDQLAAGAGELTLRYGWGDVAESACLVAQDVATAMTARGWAGGLQRCPHCSHALV